MADDLNSTAASSSSIGAADGDPTDRDPVRSSGSAETSETGRNCDGATSKSEEESKAERRRKAKEDLALFNAQRQQEIAERKRKNREEEAENSKRKAEAKQEAPDPAAAMQGVMTKMMLSSAGFAGYDPFSGS